MDTLIDNDTDSIEPILLIKPDVQLSTEQSKAVDFLLENIDKHQVIALDGPAGSGKTTLLRELIYQLESKGRNCTVTATTNKAAAVLRSKGIKTAQTTYSSCLLPVFHPPINKLASYLEDSKVFLVPPDLAAKYDSQLLLKAKETLKEQGIYSALRSLGIVDLFEYLSHWDPKGFTKGSILLVDEASMLSDDILAKIKQCFAHIVLIGDPNQLEPVSGQPVFWEIPIRVKLTEIHRQAENSAVLTMAQDILKGKMPNTLFKPVDLHLPDITNHSPVIVWTNKRRLELVTRLRSQLGCRGDMPDTGEIIISRNTQDKKLAGLGLLNNTYWEITHLSHDYRYSLKGADGTELTRQKVYMEETKCGHGAPFRFSYAITAHTAQGSEWDKIYIDAREAKAFTKAYPDQAKKWLYTAVTRARSEALFC